MPYAPATSDDIREMLGVVGVASIDELFDDIPPALRLAHDLDLPLGIDEQALVRRARELAARNVDLDRRPSFRGAGCYDHFVPAVVGAITSRSEFATAYTPYQPEVSQGTLQAIFEFQTCIARLTGLPIANASLYDGATAAAESMHLAEQVTGRRVCVVLGTVAPHIREVVATYAAPYGVEVRTAQWDEAAGTTPVSALEAVLGDDVGSVIMQQPNGFGRLEDSPALVEAAAAVGAVPVVHADPISLGVLEAPGAYGAEVCIGDGQPLGCAPAFGGPAFGFMSITERFLRRLPGRLVGETVDANGDRCYALTLQTREQHIRREKATSNICTNQALAALAGLVYLAWQGPRGLAHVAGVNVERAAAARVLLADVPGVEVLHHGAVFREFAIRTRLDAGDLARRCAARGVDPGWPAGHRSGWPELGPGALLVAVTENRSDADIRLLVDTVTEVLA